nr:hypothetical protein [Tanacetum cinerariifolium]
GRQDNYVHVSEALMAGIAVSAVESLMSSPVELFTIRSQVTTASRVPKSSKALEIMYASSSIAKVLRGWYTPDDHAYLNVIRSRSGSLGIATWIVNLNILETTPSGVPNSSGPAYQKPLVWRPHILGLYNGLGWLALGRINSVGARFGTYELLTAFYKGGLFIFLALYLLLAISASCKAVGMDPIPSSDEDIGPLRPLAVTLAAGFSGSIAAAASHSFDNAKCRSQCLVLPKYITMERKFLR